MCVATFYDEYAKCVEEIKRLQNGVVSAIDEKIISCGNTIKSVWEHSDDYDFFADWCKRCDKATSIRRALLIISKEIASSGNTARSVGIMKVIICKAKTIVA